MVLKPCKQWDKLPTSIGELAGFLNHQILPQPFYLGPGDPYAFDLRIKILDNCARKAWTLEGVCLCARIGGKMFWVPSFGSVLSSHTLPETNIDIACENGRKRKTHSFMFGIPFKSVQVQIC